MNKKEALELAIKLVYQYAYDMDTQESKRALAVAEYLEEMNDE